MKNYLLKCLALLLIGSLTVACGKDDEEDLVIPKPDETSENSTPPNNKTEEEKKDSTSTAVPEEIVPVKIEANTFPDPKFRALVSGRNYDRNGDGTLEVEEIIYIRNLYCQDMGIKSLKGIEYLKELRGIYCMNNKISDWDLSHNKLLTGIWCSGNKFTSLDFTGLDDLEWVYCHDNQLTSLNVRAIRKYHI